VRHRIYQLSHGVSFMGFRPEDFLVLFLSISLSLNVLGALFPGRLKLLVATLVGILTLRAWRRARDKMPEKFLWHLALWLSEPEVLRVGRDLRPVPLVVNPAQVVSRQPGGRRGAH
jgi:hypothetical protein